MNSFDLHKESPQINIEDHTSFQKRHIPEVIAATGYRLPITTYQTNTNNTNTLNKWDPIGKTIDHINSQKNDFPNENVSLNPILKKNQCYICFKELSVPNKLRKHLDSHKRNTIDEKGERVQLQGVH